MGSSLVKVEIKMAFAKTKDDLEQVWDKLRRKVADVQRQLPPGAGPSFVNDDFGDVYALFFAVTGDGYTLTQIDDYVDVLERELVLVPGRGPGSDARGAARGDLCRDRRARAAQLGLPLEQIYQVLRQQNLIVRRRRPPHRPAARTGQSDRPGRLGRCHRQPRPGNGRRRPGDLPERRRRR
jgi:multidrug efflux pump subunit AcrB